MISYLRQRLPALLLLLSCSGIFAAVFALYGLPVEAVLYPALLCLLLLLAVGVMDYIRFRRKRRELLALLSLPDAFLQALPSAAFPLEADYQRLLHALWEAKQCLSLAQDQRFHAMMDYYTLWAHQIKTPIAAMRLHLQQQDSSLSRTLMAELMRIDHYADMVLAYLRLDGESTDYLFREYEVDDILRQAIKRFAGEFIVRKLSLSYEPLHLKIITDEKWLLFVLEQVLSNALKYTHTGGVKIYLKEGNVLCIQDSGIGISPEDLPRIFEQGYTGASGRSDKKASGIGLYLCKRICRNLGHEIAAESIPGQGTTIFIRLQQRRLSGE